MFGGPGRGAARIPSRPEARAAAPKTAPRRTVRRLMSAEGVTGNLPAAYHFRIGLGLPHFIDLTARLAEGAGVDGCDFAEAAHGGGDYIEGEVHVFLGRVPGQAEAEA